MNFKHGLSRTPLYQIWMCIIRRCEYLENENYKYYGGRGIKVCPEWHDAATFFKWALANGYKKGLQIDRINNEGDYKPSNCHFITAKEQARNRRNNRLVKIGDEIKPLCVWSELIGINYNTLKTRVSRGWPESRLLEPVR